MTLLAALVVVLGALLVGVRSVVVLRSQVNGRAFADMTVKLLEAGEETRVDKLCGASDAPTVRAAHAAIVRSRSPQTELAPDDRAARQGELAGAFDDAFHEHARALVVTRPLSVVGAMMALLGGAWVGTLGLYAVSILGALVALGAGLLSMRLQAMLRDAEHVRDRVVEALVARALLGPYR